MVIRAVAFDFGHTLVDERKDEAIPLDSRPIHLMPGVSEVLPQIPLPLDVWANTLTATGSEIRRFLDRAGIGHFFTWVATSVDAGFRKPAPGFFAFAITQCALAPQDVLFVGNQLNSDIAGGEQYGIRTVWLSARAYRSTDETSFPGAVHPTYTIHTLHQLRPLLQRIHEAGGKGV
jgi:FMN phosphatase YigB (HAD superfamily)